MVAMRVWVKCRVSRARHRQVSMAYRRWAKSSLPTRYMPGSMRTPQVAPAKRQPKGVIPSAAMAQLISTLPRGGWVTS